MQSFFGGLFFVCLVCFPARCARAHILLVSLHMQSFFRVVRVFRGRFSSFFIMRRLLNSPTVNQLSILLSMLSL